MVNPEHLAILEQGVNAWNQWRDENPETIPDLMEAELRKAKLQWVNLKNAKLQGAKLQEAELQYAELQRAKLQGAYLSHATLQEATASQARFEHAHLNESNLQNTDLRWTNFTNANLSGSQLMQADLFEAKLSYANLERALLQGADIRSSNWERTSICGIQFDNHMKCIGSHVSNCVGSQQFIRHVMDLGYIEEFKEKHPNWHYLWAVSSDCGRSWVRLFGCCLFIIYFFWAIFNLFPNIQHPLYASIMAFTCFGFIDATNRSSQELFFICFESLAGYVMLGCLVSLIASKMARRS
nr:pentapeptide repeat-containing protein [uncultured Pseudodesulfovibrio sp.]